MLFKDYVHILNPKKFIGSKKYNKYIVLTQARSGSNMLRSLLHSHPQIISDGEIYRRLYGRNSVKMWNRFFSKKPHHIKQVGFKLFYYHPVDSDDRTVWDIIKSDSNIKLIQLSRKNKLKMIVSRDIAMKTDVWSSKRNENQKVDKRIELDTKKFIDECNQIDVWENQIEHLFPQHQLIKITYEDLVKERDKVMAEVFNFLEVDNLSVKPLFKKQNTEEIKNLILNYDQFSSEIKSTRWAFLLDE